MGKTTIYIPDELRAAIRSTARREGRSQSDVIRSALADYVGARPGPLPRSIGVASKPDVSGRDVGSLRERWAAERLSGAGRRPR